MGNDILERKTAACVLMHQLVLCNKIRKERKRNEYMWIKKCQTLIDVRKVFKVLEYTWHHLNLIKSFNTWELLREYADSEVVY